MSLPLRHGILTALSVLTLAIGTWLLLKNDGFGVVAGLCIFFGIIATVLLGLVRAEKWLAAVWPLLFLLLGIIFQHSLLLLADILIGGAFSVLFWATRQRLLNFVKFSFFPVVKPAVHLFLLVVAFGLAVGIYVGIPTQSITNTMEEGIANFEKLPLPGGAELSGFLQNILTAAENGALEQRFFRNLIEQFCNNDEACAQQLYARLQAEQQQEQNISEDSGEVTETTKDFLQNELDELSQVVNFSLITAVFFFLIFLLFSGLFALVLTVFVYPFFLLAKATKLLQVMTREVEQKLFT